MNILIVGLGSIARKHIESIRLLNYKVKIYALRSEMISTQEDEITNLYTLENLSFPIGFAIISNPTSLHYKYIKILAEKNIPLFIEKPPIDTLDNYNELISLVESKNLITYVACNLRFHPCILFLKNYIQSSLDRINEVNIYCGSYLPDWRPGKNFREIYSANRNMGGGVHLDLFHELDFTSWIFGYPIRSYSITRNVSSLEIDACDYANFIFEYEKFTANIILNYYRKKTKRTIEIIFENKIIEVDLINNIVLSDNFEILFESSNFQMIDTYVSQMEYFVNCIIKNEKPMNSLSESIEVLKIVLQNEKSTRK
jgi:predicted dehydrogenase